MREISTNVESFSKAKNAEWQAYEVPLEPYALRVLTIVNGKLDSMSEIR